MILRNERIEIRQRNNARISRSAAALYDHERRTGMPAELLVDNVFAQARKDVETDEPGNTDTLTGLQLYKERLLVALDALRRGND